MYMYLTAWLQTEWLSQLILKSKLASTYSTLFKWKYSLSWIYVCNWLICCDKWWISWSEWSNLSVSCGAGGKTPLCLIIKEAYSQRGVCQTRIDCLPSPHCNNHRCNQIIICVFLRPVVNHHLYGILAHMSRLCLRNHPLGQHLHRIFLLKVRPFYP